MNRRAYLVAGGALVDEPPVENSYTVEAAQSGRHAITVSNPRWTAGEMWYVDLVWYSAPGCRR